MARAWRDRQEGAAWAEDPRKFGGAHGGEQVEHQIDRLVGKRQVEQAGDGEVGPGAGTAGVAQGIARQVDSRKACAGQGVQHGLCIPALPAACVQDIGGGACTGQRRDLRAQRRIPAAREKPGARLAHLGAVAGVGRTAPVLPQ